MRIGLREANQQFSKAVKAVKAGKEVVLTERGRAIAVIKPLGRRRGTEARILELEAAGLLRPAARPGLMAPLTPRRLRGAPLARTVQEDRDSC
jgi:prevent-host-death family protein